MRIDVPSDVGNTMAALNPPPAIAGRTGNPDTTTLFIPHLQSFTFTVFGYFQANCQSSYRCDASPPPTVSFTIAATGSVRDYSGDKIASMKNSLVTLFSSTGIANQALSDFSLTVAAAGGRRLEASGDKRQLQSGVIISVDAKLPAGTTASTAQTFANELAKDTGRQALNTAMAGAGVTVTALTVPSADSSSDDSTGVIVGVVVGVAVVLAVVGAMMMMMKKKKTLAVVS
jgi:hypothetical protein